MRDVRQKASRAHRAGVQFETQAWVTGTGARAFRYGLGTAFCQVVAVRGDPKTAPRRGAIPQPVHPPWAGRPPAQ